MSSSTAASPARIETQRPVATPAGPRVNHIAERVRVHGSACFRVLGESMFPWIRSGDYVFVRRTDLEAASSGHVILYERGNRLFVHRVLRRKRIASIVGGGSVLITKGDALDSQDAPVSRAEFLGRVTRIHRRHRHLDLESLGSVLFGWLLARLSRASFLLYAPLRTLKHFLFA